MRAGVGALVISCCLAVILTLSGTTAASAKGKGCGQWWPDHGSITVTSYADSLQQGDARTVDRYPHVEVTTRFTFSMANLDALKCTGSHAFEVDVVTSIRSDQDTDQRSGGSNLPRGYVDTPFDDDSMTLTIGTNKLSDLRAGIEYKTTVRGSARFLNQSSFDVYLNFQRLHRSRWWHPVENTSCATHGNSDPAWCYFGDESVRMQDHGLPTTTIAKSEARVESARSW